MKNSEKNPNLELEEPIRFIKVVNGPQLCGSYAFPGYEQMLKSTHPSRAIKATLEITSDRPDDATGQPIRYTEDHVVGSNGTTYLGCQIPGPTAQKFFWKPIAAIWA